VLVELGAQVTSHPFAQNRHQPQAHVHGRLADQIHDHHGRHGQRCDRPRALQRQCSSLGRPHHAVDQITREVRRYQAEQRDHGRGRHADRQLAPVRREIAQQAPDYGGLPARHQRLRIPDRPRDTLRVQAVRLAVHELPHVALDLLLEHEADVLECPPLPVRVADQRQSRLAGRAEDGQGVRGQPGCLADRLDARPLDAAHVPAFAVTLRDREVFGAEREPCFCEQEVLVEIGESVQLDRRALPGVLDLPAQLRREPSRLGRVPLDDVVVEMLQRAHVRDPRVLCNRTASQVP